MHLSRPAMHLSQGDSNPTASGPAIPYLRLHRRTQPGPYERARSLAHRQGPEVLRTLATVAACRGCLVPTPDGDGTLLLVALGDSSHMRRSHNSGTLARPQQWPRLP